MKALLKLRNEIQDLGAPMPSPEACAKADAEAQVEREEGVERYITGRFGEPPQEFDPTTNVEQQRVASRLAQMEIEVAERRGDLEAAQAAVDALPGYFLCWIGLALVALPVELRAGVQLAQVMGFEPHNRAFFAFGLFFLTVLIAGGFYWSLAKFRESASWQKLLAAGLVLAAVLAILVLAFALAFARIDTAHDAGLPPAVRVARVLVLFGVTVAAPLTIKFALVRAAEHLGPRRRFKWAKQALARVERERDSLTTVMETTTAEARAWRSRTASHRSRYLAAYDRAARRGGGGGGGGNPPPPAVVTVTAEPVATNDTNRTATAPRSHRGNHGFRD
jgi:hypothetical protein